MALLWSVGIHRSNISECLSPPRCMAGQLTVLASRIDMDMHITATPGQDADAQRRHTFALDFRSTSSDTSIILWIPAD